MGLLCSAASRPGGEIEEVIYDDLTLAEVLLRQRLVSVSVLFDFSVCISFSIEGRCTLMGASRCRLSGWREAKGGEWDVASFVLYMAKLAGSEIMTRNPRARE